MKLHRLVYLPLIVPHIFDLRIRFCISLNRFHVLDKNRSNSEWSDLELHTVEFVLMNPADTSVIE